LDTARVDIRYRPLRIAWAIAEDDVQAFRTAVRYSYAFWGGRFNPLVVVDREREAAEIINAFNVDVICPVGNSALVKDFPKRFPHLIKPWISEGIFIDGGYGA